MTTTRDISVEDTNEAFWLNYPDQTQAAVHLALQWLAYVYPASEIHIDATLRQAQPYADPDLSSRWSQFLDEHDVEEHVEALQWVKNTFSYEQILFLVETGWRLLLVDHDLPSHVPLALRILGRILDVDEGKVFSLGESVFREYVDEDQHRSRAPLLPVDPRYLDRIEWRLLGHNTTQRLNVSALHKHKQKNYAGITGFILGSLFGASVVLFLVFGPMQLGRIKVPIMLHDGLLLESGASAQAPSAPDLIATPGVQEAPVELDIVNAPVVAETSLPDEPQLVPVESVSVAEDNNVSVAEDNDASVTEDNTVTDAGENRVLMEVTASILNVRSHPSVNSDILIKLGTGAHVWAYPDEAEGLWMLIRVEGVIGYASTRFLTEVSEG